MRLKFRMACDTLLIDRWITSVMWKVEMCNFVIGGSWKSVRYGDQCVDSFVFQIWFFGVDKVKNCRSDFFLSPRQPP